MCVLTDVILNTASMEEVTQSISPVSVIHADLEPQQQRWPLTASLVTTSRCLLSTISRGNIALRTARILFIATIVNVSYVSTVRVLLVWWRTEYMTI